LTQRCLALWHVDPSNAGAIQPRTKRYKSF